MAGTSDVYTTYLLQKGPLTAEESTLKELLLREQMTRYQPQRATTQVQSAVAPAPSSVATPPIVGNRGEVPEFEGWLLPYVSAGDLITADYMNNIVDALNGIMEFLESVTSPSTSSGPVYSQSTLELLSAKSVAGIVKDAVAETGADDVVTVRIPQAIDPGELEALVYGNRRIDPGDLVKTDEGVSFKINKAEIGTETPELLAIAKGTANQQILQLFR